jgi:sec-independent protein translocase protein TatC
VSDEPSGDQGDKATTKEDYHDPPMSLWDHLAELRKRLIISTIALAIMAGAAWEFREVILAFLVTPFADAWRAQGIPGEVKLHFQSPAAAFLGYFKLSLLGGAAAASPIVFYNLWAFITPGLYGREKKFVIPFVVCSTGLFVGGGYFGWRMVFPLAFKYLLGLSGTLEMVNVELAPTVMLGDYISFVTRLLLGFGLIF